MKKSLLSLHTDHARSFHQNRFVYPVLSRRSRGISIGVNLNPDKVCNFDCIYCQVDRRSEAETRFVEMQQLVDELGDMMQRVHSGKLYDDPKFQQVPAELRRWNDVAFSGDGEPTTYRNFDEIMQTAADLKRECGADDVKLLLITNATMFQRPAVQRGLEILDANNGEIWAKLDAGTEDYYHLIERTQIPFARVLKNLHAAAQQRPLVIQSLFMKVHGVAPPQSEIEAYCQRLNEILEAGGQIQLVQVYTVARPPAESFVTALSADQLHAIAAQVRRETGLVVEDY